MKREWVRVPCEPGATPPGESLWGSAGDLVWSARNPTVCDELVLTALRGVSGGRTVDQIVEHLRGQASKLEIYEALRRLTRAEHVLYWGGFFYVPSGVR